jgi:putative component of toxin-antitoxin plasmid stabilization module
VVETYVNLNRDVYEMVFVDANGATQTVVITLEHPLHTREGVWKPAGELEVGEQVQARDGWLTLASVRDLPNDVSTYNFKVANNHNYFVGDAGLWVHNCCASATSRIKESSLLVREAERAGRSHQASLDDLVEKLRRGLDPGLGNRPIGSGLSEARARDGARVYFRRTENGIEILGKSDKSNQEKVIAEVLKTFGGQ